MTTTTNYTILPISKPSQTKIGISNTTYISICVNIDYNNVDKLYYIFFSTNISDQEKTSPDKGKGKGRNLPVLNREDRKRRGASRNPREQRTTTNPHRPAQKKR